MHHSHHNHHNNQQGNDRCLFFSKMGACRHGDNCTKIHAKPSSSPTVLFPMMYPNPLAVEFLTDYEGPKEFDKKYLKKHFEHFYKETWRAFMDRGFIEELRVVSNLGEHLLGNVYIRFREPEDATQVVKKLRTKKFNKIPLLPELSPVTNFTEACCKEDCEGSCNRGSQCNYLHIMKVSRKLLEKLEREQSKYWKRRDKGEGHKRARSRSPSNSPSDTCHNCGAAGHTTKDCPCT